MFSIILPLLDPFDRFMAAGAVQHLVGNTLALTGDFELIVVNNNKTAACPQLTTYLRSLKESLPGKIKIVEADRNLGTARGFNAGLTVADRRGRYLVFMSSDADIVDPRMLEKIRSLMDANPQIGIAHPLSVFEDLGAYNFSKRYGSRVFCGKIRRPGTPDDHEIPEAEMDRISHALSTRSGFTSPLPCTPLTFAVFRRDMIEKIGPFDDGVEFGCYEIYDLCLRALLHGYDVARLNGIFVNHRRLYIRNLVVGGTRESNNLPHLDIIQQSYAWWMKKWGKPPLEIYARWRWGLLSGVFLWPYFRMRHYGGSIKRALVNRYFTGVL
jgi:GT2 family glycosyltransferase